MNPLEPEAAAVATPPPPEREPVIELRGLAAAVDGRTLWQGVDLVVRPGEFIAVLGPNGAGKSTLLRILLGRREPSAGTVSVCGRPPGRAGGRVGYLPQRRGIDPGLPIRAVDVVRMGLDGHRWGLPWPGRRRRADGERVAEVLELVGATHYSHRPLGQLSGGEQQRILIAQALAPGPDVLLLDEPLDSLDLHHQRAVSGLIGQLCHGSGPAVLMVAHDVNPILPHLDQVLYLAPGGSAAGSVTDVITTETLSRLYRSPVEVLHTRDGGLVVVGQPDTPAPHPAGPPGQGHGQGHSHGHGHRRGHG